MNNSTDKPLIGWREWLSLPELGIPGIKAKIDTGARSSALHTHDYEVFQRDDKDYVRFHLHPLVKKSAIELSCEAPLLGYRNVKDSGGHSQKRPFIRTRARVGEIEWEIDLSLTNRENMKFRMLLGRAALAQNFAVDPSSSYLVGKSLRRSYE
jgi:hypothetical protein